MRSQRGQAAPEYAGVLLLVAAVLGAATVIGPLPALGRTVLDQVRHGICLVTGAVCTTQEARAEGLEPCPVSVRSNREDAHVKVTFVRIGRNDALAIERRSDGTATVSFIDGWEAGYTAGAGMRFSKFDGKAEGGLGVSFTGGRSWRFASWAEAAAFVHRYARRETITGEVRDRVCLWCGHDDPPPADEVFHEGGGYAEVQLDGGVDVGRGLGIDARVRAAMVIGRRTSRTQETTYLRVDGAAAARLSALVASLGVERGGEAVLELTTEGGVPRELRVRAAAEVGARLEVMGASADLAKLATRLKAARGHAGAGDAVRGEVSLSLDLRDPANLAAARGALTALAQPDELPTRLGALARRLDAAGRVDVRLLRADLDRDETSADLEVVGAGYERSDRDNTLIGAWSRAPGGALREREDCLAATELAQE